MPSGNQLTKVQAVTISRSLGSMLENNLFPSFEQWKTKYVDKLMDWYVSKARENRRRYFMYQIGIVITGAAISTLNVIGIFDFQIRFITSILGGAIIIMSTVNQMIKHHENWLLYAMTYSRLQKENALFTQTAGKYKVADETERRATFVQNIMDILENAVQEGKAIYSK